MNKATAFASFAIGTIIGAGLVWFGTKTFWRRVVDEEIQSVKDVYAKRSVSETENKNESIEFEENFEDNIAEKTMHNDNIIVIPPEEFGTKPGFETVTLSYFADGVIKDENDDSIKDIDSTISKEALKHFGEYEEDSVFVRNYVTETDYEVLRDLRTYAEALKYGFYPTDEE